MTRSWFLLANEVGWCLTSLFLARRSLRGSRGSILRVARGGVRVAKGNGRRRASGPPMAAKTLLTEAPPFAVPDWPATTPKLIPLREIIPYPKNPRTHPPAQIELLATPMRRHGVDQPIVVDENNVILKGHGRLAAAEQAGFETFPVVRHVGLSEIDKKAMRIVDNQVALLSGWDQGLIRGELGELRVSGFDMPLLGFPESQLTGWGISSGVEGLQDAEIAPELPKKPIVCTGDLWALGE